MAFSTPASGLFLAAGEAHQFYWTWTDWQGPLYFSARLDASEFAGGQAPASDPKILAMLWQGTGSTPRALGGGVEEGYYMGIQNSTNCHVWFHLEGGGVT